MQTLLPNAAWRLVFIFGWLATSGCAPAADPRSGSSSDRPSATRGEVTGSTDGTKSDNHRGFTVEPGDGTAEGSRRYAFLVGVDDYDTHLDDRLGGLSFCEADMNSMQKNLEAIGFNRVYCLTTSSRTSWQPEKEKIEQKLQELLADKRMDANDLVLVALSGHGLERKISGGKAAAYFCPADAHSERTDSMVPIDWIYEQLNNSKAGMKLLLVDACRNLSDERGGRVPQLSSESRGFLKSLANTRPPQGIAAILSCQSGEYSHEVPKLGHGVFTHYILEGLAGKADSAAGNRDGWVSLGELFNFASDQTEGFVKNYSGRASAQTPILRGELPNYKLVRYSGPLDPTMPSELKLSFTIREKSTSGKLLSGATVGLFYRSSSSAPEVQIAISGKSSSSGRCELELPGYLSSAKGQFTALVRKDGKSKRFSLVDFPEERSWDFYCPTDEPVQLEARFSAAPDGAGVLAITATIAPGCLIYSLTQAEGGPHAATIHLEVSPTYRASEEFVPSPKPDTHIREGLQIEEHTGTVTWFASLRLDPNADPRTIVIRGLVALQADDATTSICSLLEIPFTAKYDGAMTLPTVYGERELPKELTNSLGMKLALIPAGSFQMGSPDSEDKREGDEKRHRVRITQPFYLGVHEVTVGHFRRFVFDSGYKTEAEKSDGAFGLHPKENTWRKNPSYTWRSPGFTQDNNHPVVCVSWNDAIAFAKWLSKQEDITYRLPSEAEWEYACRAGTTTQFSHGDNPEGLARIGNVADGTAKAKFNWGPKSPVINAKDDYAFTAPVGQFRKNAFGVFDMHGNVYELCQDWYDSSYYNKSPTTNPTGPTIGSSRVFRGGSWDEESSNVRAASRDGDSPDYRANYLGFRLVRVAR